MVSVFGLFSHQKVDMMSVFGLFSSEGGHGVSVWPFFIRRWTWCLCLAFFHQKVDMVSVFGLFSSEGGHGVCIVCSELGACCTCNNQADLQWKGGHRTFNDCSDGLFTWKDREQWWMCVQQWWMCMQWPVDLELAVYMKGWGALVNVYVVSCGLTVSCL